MKLLTFGERLSTNAPENGAIDWDFFKYIVCLAATKLTDKLPRRRL